MIRMKSDRTMMVFLVVFLLLLLAAREVFAQEGSKHLPGHQARELALAPSSAAKPSEKGLPELQTSAAQELLLATLAKGELVRVEELVTLPSGERFAKVTALGAPGTEAAASPLSGWIQLGSGELPRKGDSIALESSTYLFAEPIVEELTEPTPPLPEGVRIFRGSSRHPLHPREIGASAACTNFINSDGAFGPWGAFLMDRINPSEHEALFSEALADLPQVCPRFSSMGVEERKNFWVWLILAMAHHESSCNEKVKAKGVNGIAAGLLQLHLGKEQNYGCRKGIDSLKARDNLECGLTILNRDLRRTGKIFSSSNNYWQVLRPQSRSGARTLRMTKTYKPCFS